MGKGDREEMEIGEAELSFHCHCEGSTPWLKWPVPRGGVTQKEMRVDASNNSFSVSGQPPPASRTLGVPDTIGKARPALTRQILLSPLTDKGTAGVAK